MNLVSVRGVVAVIIIVVVVVSVVVIIFVIIIIISFYAVCSLEMENSQKKARHYGGKTNAQQQRRCRRQNQVCRFNEYFRWFCYCDLRNALARTLTRWLSFRGKSKNDIWKKAAKKYDSLHDSLIYFHYYRNVCARVCVLENVRLNKHMIIRSYINVHKPAHNRCHHHHHHHHHFLI